MSVYDSIGEEEQSLMAGDTKITSQIQISNFSSINFNSNLHKIHALNKHLETADRNYTII